MRYQGFPGKRWRRQKQRPQSGAGTGERAQTGTRDRHVSPSLSEDTAKQEEAERKKKAVESRKAEGPRRMLDALRR